MKKITRREFLTGALQTGLGVTLFGLAGCRRPAETVQAGPRLAVRGQDQSPIMAVASNPSPKQAVRSAIDALGGMKRFVRAGDSVILKPNISWARTPEQAATTNPEVVAEVVGICLEAGAAQVKVIDHTIDPANICLNLSTIERAAEAAGAKVASASNQAQYQAMEIPQGKILKSEQVVRQALEADVLINLPIAKVHNATGVTLGMKNLMGLIWNRQAWHASLDLHHCIAEFASALQPDLTILDATNILLTNGPNGPGETKALHQVAAGIDPVAIDSYGAKLLGKSPVGISHIAQAHELGLGEINLDRIEIKSA